MSKFKNKIKRFCLLTFIVISSITYCQEITVTGIVIDETKQEVPYATITFKNNESSTKVYGMLTNENGQFSIQLPKANYTFQVSIVGIKPYEKNINLQNATETLDLGTITIQTNVNLEEVVVTSDNSKRIELDKKVYSVAKDIITTGGSLINVMENVPSVQVEADGTINLRGNSVTILIDGKIMGMTNSASFLQTIPAGSIDKIEVITNPSSKYESGGAGGIINVILKKNKEKHLSSSLEIFSGIRLNSGINININNQNEKYSWYVNSGLGYSEPKATNTMDVENFNSSPNKYFQNSTRITNQFYNTNVVGGKLFINDKSYFSTDITYRFADVSIDNPIFYEDYQDDMLLVKSERLNKEKNKNNFFLVSSEYKLKLDDIGSELKLSALGQQSDENEKSKIAENDIFPLEVTTINDAIGNETFDTRYAVAVDYVKTTTKNAQLELGIINRGMHIKNNFSVERFINDVATVIPEFTDNTTYKQTIWAGYVQYAKKYKKLSFQLGLRAEKTSIDIFTKNGNEKIVQNYTDIFPSSFIDYKFNNLNTIRFSISRRIQRPRRDALTPLNSFSDARNIYAGNPEVKPTYSILAELGYKTKINNTLSITPTLFYRNIKNVLNNVVQNEEVTFNGIPEDVFVVRTENIGDYDACGLEISTTYTPFTWFRLYNEVNMLNFSQNGLYKSSGFFMYGNLNLSFTFPKLIKFQIQNRFANSRRRGQIYQNNIYRMNLGVSKELFNNKAALSLNFNDVFDTWEWRLERIENTFIQRINNQQRIPQFNVSFIYRMNQKKYKGKKGRQYDRRQQI